MKKNYTHILRKIIQAKSLVKKLADGSFMFTKNCKLSFLASSGEDVSNFQNILDVPGVTKRKLLTIRMLFLETLLILGGIISNADSQITTLNAWSNLYHGTSSTTQNITYPIPTGSNSVRALVIAIASSTTATGAQTVTLTYGGQSLISVNGDMSSTTPRQHTQLYYLNEAGIEAATNTTLAVTVSGGTTRVTDVFASVFDNVNQTSPITDSKNYNSGTGNTNNPVFATALTVNAGDQAIEIISSLRSNNTTPRIITYATNWTMSLEQTYTITTDGVRNGVANRSISGVNTTDLSSTNLSGSTLASMTGMSLMLARKYFRSITSGNWNSTSTWQQSNDNINWVSATSTPTNNDNVVTIQTGNTVTLTAAATALSVTNNGTLDLSTYTLTGINTLTVSSTGLLIIGGASNFPTGFATNTLSSGSTVNYDNAGVQTVSGQTYSNLILSGTGAKTTTGVTVNGILSLEGTATASVAPTYGAAATLQYNTSTARTAGVEWVSPVAATGGIIVTNTGAITMNSAEILNASVPLTINTGATLTTGNYQLNLGGDFNNSGTFNGGNSPIVITGTAATQGIDGFTTTGVVSMTKTSGIATFHGNVNGGGLTINGTGGTLNLGTGLTHVISGTWTRSAGTLDGGSSLLRIGVSISGTGGTFTASSGNVEWYAAGNQTIAGIQYYNLTISGSGIKTLAAAIPTINGTLTVRAGTTLALSTFPIGATTGPSSVVMEIGATGSIISGNGAGVLHLGGNVTVNYITGSSGATISCPINLDNNRTFTVADDLSSATDLTVNGIINDGAVASAITKAGPGTMILSGANIYTGTTTVSAGTLKLGNASALGTGAGGTTVANGAVLDLNGITLSTAEPLTINGTGISMGGALINSSGTASTYNGAITLASASSISTTGNITLGGGITGGFDLTKAGSATLSLGSTTATLGALSISAGTLTSTSGTMNLSGNFTNSGTFSHNSGTVNFNGSGSQSINGLTTFNNLILAGSGTKTFINNTTISGNLVLGTGVIASLGTGLTHTANSLSLAGLGQASGSWGSTSSTATNKNNSYFDATNGIITVASDTRLTPVFSGITSSQSSCLGASVTLSGTVSSGSVYPANGEIVGVTINGVSQNATIAGGVGGFSINYNTSSLTAGSYTITYTYGGNSYLKAAANSANTTLTVNALIGSNTLDYTNGLHGVLCATAGENGNAVLTAPAGTVFINVGFASYGTPTGTCPVFSIGGCNSPTSQSVTEGLVLGYNTATISASNGIFGDPCVGTLKNYEVQATYTQPICSGTSPGTITGSTPTGGNGTFTYLWESSTTSSTSGFSTATGTSTSINYTVPILSQTTWFRRTVNSGGCSNVSTVILVQVTPAIANNTITSAQTIGYGSTPAALTGTTPTGGTGTYTYLWESSVTNATTGFTTAIGTSNIQNYSPGVLTQTTWYRRTVTSGGCSVISTAIQITVTLPTITTSTATLTGFTYPVGYGPSGQQSVTVNGTNLLSNINVTPSASFEISTGSGASFVAMNPVTLYASGGIVNNAIIYVRMKSGLALGAVAAENISVTAISAATNNVSCSGTVATAPVITSSITTFPTTFTYSYTSGPSSQQTFNVSGTNLLGNVIITPPTDYEISTTTGSGFVSTPISLTPAGGLLSTTPIYARLKIGLGVGSYSENLVLTSTSATTVNVTCNGTITTAPTIITTPSFLSGFIYDTTKGGPSGQQSFLVSGSNLGSNSVKITPPSNYEISTTSGSGFQSTALTLTPTSGTVSSTIYARLKSGLAVGIYGPANDSIKCTGAIIKTVAFNGSVVNSATILTSKTALTGFGYMAGNGPSSEQTFTVSGASLSVNITVTPPANYEISTTSGSGFQSTAITLTQASGRVNPTIIYARLKSALVAGNYTGVNITVASTGVTSQNIACVGIVYVSPLITAGGGGSYCEGTSINLTSVGADIINRYWQGPNSFYSTAQNPTITGATTAMSGTYTATGNVTVGGNLITNGDFELGSFGIGSGYIYTVPGKTVNANGNLWPEGYFTVDNLPITSHTGFGSCVDHTSGAGKQMIINGAGVAGVVIWSQSVSVIPGATYQFSYWVQTVDNTHLNPSQLQLYVNGVAAGPTYTANAVTCGWIQFIYNATSGSNTSLNLELINQNIALNGNDFALDDIVFIQILPATSSVTVTVNPNLPVSVAVAASANPVYSGTPVTFTATPTNGGTTPAYQWKVNGTVVGTNSTTYTYTPITGDVITCVLTSSYTCATSNPASNAVTMTVIHRTNYWMGSIDTDWGKAGNWTASYIPLTGDDVEYATIGNFGSTAVNDLILDNDRTIGNLINATTKRLVIPQTKGLIVNYSITTDGNPSRVYIQSSNVAANGSLTFHNVVGLPVNATVEMYSKAYFNLNDPTPNNRYKWQYFGIPLRSVVANPTFYGSYVRKWYESGTTISNHWLQLGNDSVLTSFLGYEICQQSPKTIIFQGQLENGDFNSGQLAVTATALFPGQHVYANPYTAAIDIKQLTFGSQTEATVYLYTTGTFNQWTNIGQKISGDNPGQYHAVPKDHAGDIGIPRQIPSMQAMLVKAMSNSTNATFGITYNSVVMNNTDQQRIKESNDVISSDKICTLIDINGTNYSDRMWIFSDPTCTHHFDNGQDGAKMLGSALSPQLYAVESDGNYQVDGVDDMNNTVLGFQAGQDINYTLTFTQLNIKSKYAGVYLTDKVENKTIDITESGTTYSFLAESTSQTANRFVIVTRPYEQSSPDKDSQLKIFSSKSTIMVQNLSTVNGELMIYDIVGHYLKKVSLPPNGGITSVTGIIPGAYIAKAFTSKEGVTKRIIVQ